MSPLYPLSRIGFSVVQLFLKHQWITSRHLEIKETLLADLHPEAFILIFFVSEYDGNCSANSFIRFLLSFKGGKSPNAQLLWSDLPQSRLETRQVFLWRSDPPVLQYTYFISFSYSIVHLLWFAGQGFFRDQDVTLSYQGTSGGQVSRVTYLISSQGHLVLLAHPSAGTASGWSGCRLCLGHFCPKASGRFQFPREGLHLGI